jgi:integrase
MERMMPSTKLTELSVTKMRAPKTGRIEYFDTLLPSFGLRITASGVKSWVLMTRVHGKLKRVTLGRFPVVGLADARDLARKAIADAQEGKTPIGARNRRQSLTGDTVAAALAEFIARDQRGKGRRSWRQVEQVLTRELTAAGWMDRQITGIGKRDVVEILDQVMDRRASYMANRTLAHLRRMLAWCVERGILETSPAAGVRAPGEERSRDRELDPHELAMVWRGCDALGWPFGPLVRLLITTAQRRDEVAHMAWPDMDLERRLWTLPRELTKADRVHEVPLSTLAIEIIDDLPRLGDGLAFPANRSGSRRAVSGFSKAKAKLDAEMLKLLRKEAAESGGDPAKVKLEPWRLHDLRRTAASNMARLGHPPHVVSAILNHAPAATQGITAIYNRHRYGDEKRAALEAWGREVERIIGRSEATVVQLRA